MTNTQSRLLQSIQSHEVFEALFRASPVILHAVDHMGRFVGVNKVLADKLGYRAQEMRGQPMINYLTESARSCANQNGIPAFDRKGRSKAIEYDFARKDGGVLPVIMSAFTQHDAQGNELRSFVVGFESSEKAKVSQTVRHHKKMVLIVEDDSNVRTVLAKQLEGEQLRVFQAETGDLAFKAMDSGLQPDLLLTDVVMPGALQGPELAQRARAMLPDLRVLFMSGYPVEMSPFADELEPNDRQLIKPVTQSKLVTAVKELLVED